MAGGRWQHGESPKRGIQVGPNPTDRAKNGVKRSVLVEGHGLPLAAMAGRAAISFHATGAGAEAGAELPLSGAAAAAAAGTRTRVR